jgi:hypothetical protein
VSPSHSQNGDLVVHNQTHVVLRAALPVEVEESDLFAVKAKSSLRSIAVLNVNADPVRTLSVFFCSRLLSLRKVSRHRYLKPDT